VSSETNRPSHCILLSQPQQPAGVAKGLLVGSGPAAADVPNLDLSRQAGKTMALFSATSLILVNLLVVFLLGDVLSIKVYFAIALVVLALVLLSLST
jgi:hypothetical protein